VSSVLVGGTGTRVLVTWAHEVRRRFPRPQRPAVGRAAVLIEAKVGPPAAAPQDDDVQQWRTVLQLCDQGAGPFWNGADLTICKIDDDNRDEAFRLQLPRIAEQPRSPRGRWVQPPRAARVRERMPRRRPWDTRDLRSGSVSTRPSTLVRSEWLRGTEALAHVDDVGRLLSARASLPICG